MMTLSLADYLSIVAVCTVVVIRVLADIREVVSARAVNRTVRAIVRRNFSPSLTVIVPLESVDATKRMIRQLQKNDLNISTVVVIDSSLHLGAAAALRYFVKKNALQKTQIIARKNPNLFKVASKATTRLVVALPDTTELFETFYHDAVLAFGDAKVDAVRLSSSIRPGKTIIGGIETSAHALRQYADYRKARFVFDATLPKAFIVRTKYLRRAPKRELRVLDTQKSVYSTKAGDTFTSSLANILRLRTVFDYMTAILAAGVSVLLLQGHSDQPLIIGICLLFYGMLVWWSLGLARTKLIDRMAITLLAPMLIIIIVAIVVIGALSNIVPRRSKQGNGTLRQSKPKYA